MKRATFREMILLAITFMWTSGMAGVRERKRVTTGGIND
jgi:hypothetical protein